ncbi:choice-of-anchor M domain-containing protein [Alloscardovia omnicolens]|uniref:choice-of-anchor M domain-containing protein n=1 Tax=Alloscardovia omnicolens TaxID=419015 RepID=UPI003A6CDCAA
MATLVKNLKRCEMTVLALMISLSILCGASSLQAFASTMNYKDQDLTIERGHVDVFYPFIKDGKILQGLEYGHTLYNPNRTTLTVPVSMYSEKNLNHPELPHDFSYGYWFLDQSQSDMNVAPYPGWDTGEGREAVGARTSHDATADIVVTRVSAPEDGKVLIFDSGEVGGSAKSFEKNDKDDTDEKGSRFAMPGILHQDSLSHQHANWIFTAAGTYHLDVKTIITSKATGKSVSTGVVRYTFVVKDNTGQVYSDKDNVVTELADSPSSDSSHTTQPNDSKPIDHTDTTPHNPGNNAGASSEGDETSSENPSDSNDSSASEFKIHGNRDKGAHAHFHSYEYSGLSLYIPAENIPRGTQKLEWRYVRADEAPDGGTTLYANTLDLPAEPAMNNMMVYVRALDVHSRELARAKAHIAVDDHGTDMRPVVRAIADERVYKPGETVKFSSKLYNPSVPVDSEGLMTSNPVGTVTSIVQKRVWLIKKKGETQFTQIDIPRNTEVEDETLIRQVDDTLDLVVDKSMDGATVRASLAFDDGTLYRNERFDSFSDVVLQVQEGNNNSSSGVATGNTGQTPTDNKGENNAENKPSSSQNTAHTGSSSSTTVPPAPVPTVIPGDAPKNSGVYDTSHSGAGLASKFTPFVTNMEAQVSPATLSQQLANFGAPESSGGIFSTGASIAAPAQEESDSSTDSSGQSTLLNPQETAYKATGNKKQALKSSQLSARDHTSTPWILMVASGILTLALCAMAVVATILVVKRRLR